MGGPDGDNPEETVENIVENILKNIVEDIFNTLGNSPIGQEIVQLLIENHIYTVFGKAGRGTYYRADKKLMVIDPYTPFAPDVAVANLIMRALPRLSSQESLDPIVYVDPEDYVNAEIEDLASAIINQIRYNKQRNKATYNYAPTTLEYLLLM